MKKLISLILALMLVLGMSVSSHAETTDEQKQMISFRGIPWGCSPDVALEMLEEQFGKDSIKVTRTDLSSGKYCRYSEDDKSEKIRIPMLCYSVKIEDCKVAGYDAEELLLYFIPKLSEDGQSYDLSETVGKFWHAMYKLSRPDAMNVEEMRTDLSGKIDTLYKDTATKGMKKMESTSMKMNMTLSGKTSSTISTRLCSHLIWSDDFSQLEMCQVTASGTNLTYKCNFDRYSSEARAIKKLIDQKGAAAKQAESQKRIEDAVGTGTDGL